MSVGAKGLTSSSSSATCSKEDFMEHDQVKIHILYSINSLVIKL